MSIAHPCGITFSVQQGWNNVSYVDITDDIRVMNVSTANRGRLANTWDPGPLVIQFDNRDRKYDPTNTSGPYYGTMIPGALTRVIFGADDVWFGVLDGIKIDYDRSNKDSVATFTFVDGLAQAAITKIPAGVTPAITLGESIIDRGTALKNSITSFSPTIGRPSWAVALNYQAQCSGVDEWDANVDHVLIDEVRKMADLEQAPAFAAARSNGIEMFPRYWWQLMSEAITSQASIGTGGLPFLNIEVAWDSSEVITAVSMVSSAGDAVVAIDTAGEATYGTRYPSVSYSDIPARDAGQLESAANTVIGLRATENFRVESIQVRPGADAAWPAKILSLAPLHRVTITYTPTLTGTAHSADYFIDGITHQITPDDWVTTFSFMAANRFDDALGGLNVFTLDSSTFDGPDVFGF